MATPKSGIKFFTAGAYMQAGWTAFADTQKTLLPAHDMRALEPDAFRCVVEETIGAGELVAVVLPRYDQPVPDLTGGKARPATDAEKARLRQELADTDGGG